MQALSNFLPNPPSSFLKDVLISRFRNLFFLQKSIFRLFIIPYHLEIVFHGPKVILGRTRAKVTFFRAIFIDLSAHVPLGA